MNKRKWTEQEEQYILDNFNKVTLSHMSKKLKCTILTVQNRAIELGLSVEKKSQNRWTEEEIELLKIMAPKYLNKTIAKKLGRPANEVNRKAKSLNIELIFKTPIWKNWKIEYLKENINKMSLVQLQKELEVSYYQITDKIEELGLEYNKNNWTEEEEKILIELSSRVYIREIAKILNRTEQAIITKARKMGLDYLTLKRNFTEEELSYIKNNWHIIPVNDLARNLKVSRAMIQKQADKMHLPKLGNNPYRKWTEEEKTKLKELAPFKTISELAKHFKTTNQAIITIAYRNGIELIDSKIRWTEEDKLQLKTLAQTLDLSELADTLNRTASAIYAQAKRQNITIIPDKKSSESIWTEENTRQLLKLAKEEKNLFEICSIMKKRDATILTKSRELGINIKREEIRPWTEEEIKKLKTLAKTKQISELVLELKRTTSSIRTMARKLNIQLIVENKNWTKEEIKLLEKLTMEDKKDPKDIAKILGRTEQSIKVKMNRLGLKDQTSDKRFWTPEEETLLSDLWGTESFEYIASKLQRSVSSIKNKAYMLNLGSSIENNYNGLTLKDVSEILKISIDIISTAWISLGLKYKIQKISKSKSYRYIEITDLYDFLEKNQNIWDSRNLEKNILGQEPDWLKEKRKRDIEQNLELERLNITKQQLILTKQYYLEQLNNQDTQEELNEGPSLVKKRENLKYKKDGEYYE